MLKALGLGLVAALFFASTFVLNRAMELGGGSWLWSASLRYLCMVAPLLGIVALRGNLRGLYAAMRRHPGRWLGWSTVGFGLFYAPLCWAATRSPAWVVASTWQITIVAGSLLVPFVAAGRARIPRRSVAVAVVILVGVVLVQLQAAAQLAVSSIVLGSLPVVVAAFAYPLGNRMLMRWYGDTLDTFQRVLGMTLASLPFWFVVAGAAWFTTGLPSASQVEQSLLVALLAGVVATVLFFRATDLSRGNVRQLAAVEATQAGEVVFALAGEILWLQGAWPTPLAWLGLVIIVAGMLLQSWLARQSAGAG